MCEDYCKFSPTASSLQTSFHHTDTMGQMKPKTVMLCIFLNTNGSSSYSNSRNPSVCVLPAESKLVRRMDNDDMGPSWLGRDLI